MQDCNGGSASGIRLRETTCRMENNEVVKCQGEAIEISGGGSAGGERVEVMNTLCKENGGSGIMVRGFNGLVIVQDCIMSNNDLNGIQVEPAVENNSKSSIQPQSYLLLNRVELKDNKFYGLHLR